MVNHGNICVVNIFSLVKNLDGGELMKFYFLTDMSYEENVTLNVNSLYGLQQLDSTHTLQEKLILMIVKIHQ